MICNPEFYQEIKTILHFYTADEERAVHVQTLYDTLQAQLLEDCILVHAYTQFKISKYNNKKKTVVLLALPHFTFPGFILNSKQPGQFFHRKAKATLRH